MTKANGAYYLMWVTDEVEDRLNASNGSGWLLVANGDDVRGHDVGSDLATSEQAAVAKAAKVGTTVEL